VLFSPPRHEAAQAHSCLRDGRVLLLANYQLVNPTVSELHATCHMPLHWMRGPSYMAPTAARGAATVCTSHPLSSVYAPLSNESSYSTPANRQKPHVVEHALSNRTAARCTQTSPLTPPCTPTQHCLHTQAVPCTTQLGAHQAGITQLDPALREHAEAATAAARCCCCWVPAWLSSNLLKLPKPQAADRPLNTPTAMTDCKRCMWLLSQ
jgi:hypothetical protein